MQECCETGEECILDLLDYCQRSITSLLVKCEEGEGRSGGGRVVESEESSEEDGESDDENVPSKKKILEVKCIF